MNIDEACIMDGLAGLGITSGDAVLVHSALSSMGYVSGGAETVIQSLLNVVGPEGTVLFPTLTGSTEDSQSSPPHFDTKLTPTWVGRIPEIAMGHPDSVRSCHPTHSVCAMGKDRFTLTQDHQIAKTPCGEGSPYVRLAEAGGKILLIGVNHERNTTFHTAEELAGMDYVFLEEGPLTCPVVDRDGDSHLVETPIHRWDIPRYFESMNAPLQEKGIVQVGNIGDAPCRVMKSQELIDFLMGALKADPGCLRR